MLMCGRIIALFLGEVQLVGCHDGSGGGDHLALGRFGVGHDA